MWQRFTERARRVVFLAQEEADKLGENEVCTGHLLLGLALLDDGAAVEILNRMGISLDVIRQEVLGVMQPYRSAAEKKEMQLSNPAKHAIDLAYDEARALKDDYIGTEHLLLGIAREEVGAGRVLVKLGADADRVRAVLLELRSQPSDKA